MKFPRSPLAVAIAAAVVLSACSGDADTAESSPTVDSQPATTVAPTVAPDPTVPDATADAATDDDSGADDAVPQYEVGVDYSIGGQVTNARLAVAVAGDEVGDLDPFGRFASCSGLREVIGAYSVSVSDPGNGAIGLLTDGPVSGAGIYDADVRVEPVSGGAVTASGTVTLDADLAAGTFLAFTPDGIQVDGSFTCDGGPSTTPLERVGDDGDAKIEVFALLRRGDAERVVGAAALANGDVDAECPAAAGIGDGVLVRLDGDERMGAITTFELTDGASPTMRLRVGGTRLEADGVQISAVDGAAAGAFSGTAADGTEVDGAYRCS